MSGQDAGTREELQRLRDALARTEEALQDMRERMTLDLDRARRELAQSRIEQEALAEQLHQRNRPSQSDTARRSVAASSPGRSGMRRLWRASRLMMLSGERALRRDMRLLHASDLFDGDWYLAEYPDVAGTGIDPAEHYLRFGALEGRDPGPQFRTAAYLRDHPDLAEGRGNALLHFLRSRQGVARP